MYQWIVFALLFTFSCVAQTESDSKETPKKAVTESITTSSPSKLSVPTNVQMMSPVNVNIIPDLTWRGWWMFGEAGAGWLVGIVTLIVTGRLAYKQSKMQLEMNDWQKEEAKAQAEIQEQMNKGQRIQAQGQIFIPLFLKLLDANRQFESLAIEQERDAAQATESQIEAEMKRVEGATKDGLKDMWYTLNKVHLLRLKRALEPKKKQIENVLYPQIEGICYLMEKDLITDPKFTAPFQENFPLWKENLQEHMHIDGFPAFGQYPYFSRQYTKWQLNNPQASPIPTLDLSEE